MAVVLGPDPVRQPPQLLAVVYTLCGANRSRSAGSTRRPSGTRRRCRRAGRAPLLAQRLQRLRRPAGVDVHRLPLGRPRDVVVARAADGADGRRHLVLEDHHVARDAALGRGCHTTAAPLKPDCGRAGPMVVDHHRDRVALRDGRRHEPAGQRRRHRRGVGSGVGVGCRRRDGGRRGLRASAMASAVGVGVGGRRGRAAWLGVGLGSDRRRRPRDAPTPTPATAASASAPRKIGLARAGPATALVTATGHVIPRSIRRERLGARRRTAAG